MSYKFDSLITVLRRLDAGEKVTVRSLMEELEVSERTAYRYIQTLQVAGFPVSYDRNLGRYAFDEGYSLGRPDLTVDESLALALSKRLLGSVVTGMEKGLESIERKLAVKEPALPGHIVMQAERLSPLVEGYLCGIYRAIINFKRVDLKYRSLYADEETERKVDPYYLFFKDGFWHLRGYCHLREDLRTFALDRVMSLRMLDENFVPTGVSSDEELSGAFGADLDGRPVDIVLRFDPEIKPYVTRRKWHISQSERELKDGRLDLRFRVNGTDEIKRWIYRWLPHVEVARPKDLKAEVEAELRSALKRFKR